MSMDRHFKQSLVALFTGSIQLATGIWLTIFVGTSMLSWALLAIGGFAVFSNIFGAIANRQAKKSVEGSQPFKNLLNDEREAAISDKAKAFTHDFASWTMWAAIIVLAVLQVEVWIPTVLVGVLLVRMVVTIVAMFWFRKRM
ncbi:MAG: hypothetical protein FWG38_00840 [Defluviitaleaceae bacterium]|nr:hypothetical protein [Defluviitaleaceae bacterium]